MTLRQLTKDIQKCVNVPADGIYGPQTARAILNHIHPTTRVPIDNAVAAQFDTRSEKNLKTCEPKAEAKFRKFFAQAVAVAAAMGVEAKVICGRRGRAAQETAKRKGASKAGYGYSWHNYGMAIDLGLFAGGRYLDSTDPKRAHRVYKAIAEVGRQHGLICGFDWGWDSPHFQIDTGYTSPRSTHRRQLANNSWAYN